LVFRERHETLAKRKDAEGTIWMKKAAYYMSGFLLATGSLGHGVHFFAGIEVAVAGILVPTWVSLPSMIVGGLLAIWIAVGAWRL